MCNVQLPAGCSTNFVSSQWILIGSIDLVKGSPNYPIGGGSATIASASLVDLSTTPASYVTITGNASISYLGTLPAGQIKLLYFTGNATLVAGPNLILPGGTSFQTPLNYWVLAVSQGGGIWSIASFSSFTALNVLQPAALATATPLPSNVYSNGVLGSGATLQGVANGALSVDGSAVTVGERILVKNEANAAYDGVYVDTTPGSGSLPYLLTRSSDFNTTANILGGSQIFVQGGSTNVGTTWTMAEAGAVIVGTTALNWMQSGQSLTYSAGQGLALSGTQFYVPNGAITGAMLASGAGLAAANNLSDVQSLPISLANLLGQPVTITATGNLPVNATNILWRPTVPANSTFTLPASPTLGEIHTLQYLATTGNFVMTVAGNTGQSIDGNPSWNLVSYGDSLSVRYAGSNVWTIIPGLGGSGSYTAISFAGTGQVANTAALQATPTSAFPNGVIRTTDGQAGAPPLFFYGLTGTCAANGLVSDGGSCVNTTIGDGNSWKAQFAGDSVDDLQWGIVSGSAADQQPFVQAALTFVGNRGGGTVKVPGGGFTLKSQLMVPAHTTLQCANNGWTFGQLGVPSINSGSVFEVEWGSGAGNSNNPADAALQLRATGAVKDCGWVYPNVNYTATTPTEYGATILAYDTTKGNVGQTATGNFCFNCYSFLDFRGSVANQPVANATIIYNWGAPIAYGLRINLINDWSHYDHNIFHNGGYDLGDVNFGSHLPGWTATYGVAFEVGNSDWVNLQDEQEWGYADGVSLLFNGTYYPSFGPVWIQHSQFDACAVSCIADTPGSADSSPLSILALRVLNSTFTAFNPITNTASSSAGGLVLSINTNSVPKKLDFSHNFIFGPTNYVFYGCAVDEVFDDNSSYPNVTSSVAASGPAITNGTCGNTLVMTNNTFTGWNNLYTSGAVAKPIVNTGNSPP